MRALYRSLRALNHRFCSQTFVITFAKRPNAEAVTVYNLPASDAAAVSGFCSTASLNADRV